MSIRTWIKSLFHSPTRKVFDAVPKFILTDSCLEAIRSGLDPEIKKKHEGIVYLLGRTDGVAAAAISVFRPRAITSPGSFYVDPGAMAVCIELAAKYELQIVGQLHTHPGHAYHSDGDVEGARIRYPGYISVVLPNYGVELPSLVGAAVYMWTADGVWLELSPEDLIIVPGAGPWTNNATTKSATIAPFGTQRVV